MSGVSDLFFDEFYAELETAMEDYVNLEHDLEPPASQTNSLTDGTPTYLGTGIPARS